MNYLVTGGTGFVGSYVLRDLLRKQEKENKIVAYDYRTSNIIDEILTQEQKEKVEIVNGDITNYVKLYQTIKENNIDKIIHLASMLHPACDNDPNKAIKVNIEGQSVVLEAAKLFDIEKVVWASSVVVFGDREHHEEEFLSNGAYHHPANIYSATKIFNEYLTEHYSKKWNLDTLGLRFTVVYGPGRIRGASSFVNQLITEPALGNSSTVDNGDDVVDWAYVEDVSSLIVKCIEIDETETKIFNTQFDIKSVKEAGDYVEKITGVNIDYNSGIFGIKWELDDSKLQNEIGFEPEYNMEKGIKKTINYVRSKKGMDKID